MILFQSLTTYGVNTLISDSGVIKYRIVTEQWEVNENKKPSRWTFNKGILLTQFDLKKHIVGYIQCDTAVYLIKIVVGNSMDVLGFLLHKDSPFIVMNSFGMKGIIRCGHTLILIYELLTKI